MTIPASRIDVTQRVPDRQVPSMCTPRASQGRGAEAGIVADPVTDPEAAMRLLEAGDTDAFVYDAAITQYLIGQGYSTQIAGPILQPESYGIVLPEGSPILEAVDLALLAEHPEHADQS